MPSTTTIIRFTTAAAVICWLGLVVVDLMMGFEMSNTNVELGIPRFLSSLLLTGYIVSLFFHYQHRLASADNLNFIELLWRVFVTGLIATIVSVFIEFFLSFVVSGSKLAEHELLLSLLYHINMGLILAFVISTFLVWKKLVLYQKTKSLLRTWQVFEYTFLASLLFHFIPHIRFDLPFSVIFAFLVALGFVISPNLKWVAFLNFKQKWKTILLILLVLLYLGYFLIYLLEQRDNELLITDLTNHVSVLSIYTFIILYAISSLLVTLFNLPTTSVFEQKLEEVINFQRLSQTGQAGQSQEEIYDLLLESSMSASFANAAWFEFNNKNENPVLITRNIKERDLDKVRTAIQAQSEKRTKRPGISSRVSQRDTLTENIRHTIYKSVLIYPLEVQQEKIGTMILLKEVSDGFNNDVVNIVNTFGNQAAVSIENYRLLQSAIENERYREELNIAKRVHESLLPSTLESNEHFEITAYSKPADEVGGDYYDTHRISQDKFAMIIGDVSGKGTSAAFNMSQMKGVFHSLAQIDLDPREFLVKANHALGRCLERTSFITLSYFILDTSERTIQFSRAGHCPSLYFENFRSKLEFLKSKGLGLGIIRNEEYCNYVEVNQITFNTGDLLVMYTDGITEAKNPDGEEFGYDRLKQIVQNNIRKSARDIQDGIINGLLDFTQADEIEDDFTTMILKFN